MDGKVVLITGGTGSFGKQCVQMILERYAVQKLIVFSRDELKQFEMQQMFPAAENACLRYFIGDVRDKDRLYRAFSGVDIVIHAAAMKQVPAAEYNPFEAVKTNIIGAQNVIDAAIDQHVKKVIALSTDKAANPLNLYGATKLCSDKIFIAGNAYTGRKVQTIFSVVRYGNVIGSRGSVIPCFLQKRETGVLPVTDLRMTRFWITLEQAVNFVCHCLGKMTGGELFVPKLPSMAIADLATAICPDCRHEMIGIRPGEKLHEVMIPADESRMVVEFDDYYVIQPDFSFFSKGQMPMDKCLGAVPDDFEYSSGTNPHFLTVAQMQTLIQPLLKGQKEA
ncbi:MAG: UDP-N-acetylglucosamine 4,6-dehydratase (inverting) [Desulfobacterales bacterium]|nr:UDP-N-acetylglucosamine 4,6-dehydratase (inverting) [Desulfobacterales bacterium]